MNYRLATIHPLRTTTDKQTTATDRRQAYHKLNRYLNMVG